MTRMRKWEEEVGEFKCIAWLYVKQCSTGVAVTDRDGITWSQEAVRRSAQVQCVSEERVAKVKVEERRVKGEG